MEKEEIAKYAYENVPFYKDLVSAQITSWESYPIVDKKMLLQRRDTVFSPEYMRDLLTDKLEHVMTSGSTGDCLDVFWDKKQNRKSLISLWVKRKKYYGITPKDRRCYFFTTKIVKGEELYVEETKFGLGFSKYNLRESRMIEIYKRICDFNPKWFLMQPSMVLLIIQIVNKYNLPLPSQLTYIELTGERIEKAVKNRIANFFGCKVASQYGCYEVNSIAYECVCGNLHVMTENVFLETLEGEELCVTSLHNKVMPFIRYKIGDRGRVIINHNCSCNSKEPVVELDMARDNDWIYNPDGTVCHSDLFCNVIEKINLVLQQVIEQYQIVQKSYKEFEVYLVISDLNEKSIIQELFIKYYEKYQERSRFEFFFVDYLYPSEKTGKLAWFTSKVKGEGKNEN